MILQQHYFKEGSWISSPARLNSKGRPNERWKQIGKCPAVVGQNMWKFGIRLKASPRYHVGFHRSLRGLTLQMRRLQGIQAIPRCRCWAQKGEPHAIDKLCLRVWVLAWLMTSDIQTSTSSIFAFFLWICNITIFNNLYICIYIFFLHMWCIYGCHGIPTPPDFVLWLAWISWRGALASSWLICYRSSKATPKGFEFLRLVWEGHTNEIYNLYTYYMFTQFYTHRVYK